MTTRCGSRRCVPWCWRKERAGSDLPLQGTIIDDVISLDRGQGLISMIHDRINVDPNVMFGKPVIKGTRITVELILRKLAAGMSDEQILAHHPHLTVEDIRAAAAF